MKKVQNLFNPEWMYTIFPNQSLLIAVPYEPHKCLSIHAVKVDPRYEREDMLYADDTPFAHLRACGFDASFFLSGQLMVEIDSLQNYIDHKDAIDNRIRKELNEVDA